MSKGGRDLLPSIVALSLIGAAGLYGCSSEAPQPPAMSVADSRAFVTSALAKCNAAAGQMGSELSGIGAGRGNFVRAYQASQEVEAECNRASVTIDRASLPKAIHDECLNVPETARLLAANVQTALDNPGKPSAMALMGEASELHTASIGRCDSFLTDA